MLSVHKELDKLLGKGLLSKNITHIYGPPNSGKTNLALMATKNAAKEGKVIYIDSEGGFSIERLKQLCGEHNFEKVQENLMLIEPADYEEQKVAIKKLSEIVPKKDAKLVIVDSISVLYRLQEERSTKVLGRQLAQLLKIARKYEIPTLITNQVYTDIETQEVVPVGGDVLVYWSKVILSLDKKGKERIATLVKHKFLPEGLQVKFKICEEGIEVSDKDKRASRNHHTSPS